MNKTHSIIRFQDKVAIVTSGASGIKLAVAKWLASEEARLVLADISEESLNKALPAVKAAGPNRTLIYL